MVTVQLYVKNTPKNYEIIKSILNAIPCFILNSKITNSALSLDIKYRKEDQQAVEKIIAKII